MPRWIAAFLVALIVVSTSADAAGRPQVRRGEPYVKARARLITQGYAPVRFVVRTNGYPCSGDGYTCAAFPENRDCEGTTFVVCGFILQHPSTGRLWEVSAKGEIDQTVLEAFPADPCEFEGATIQFPNGRRLMYRRSCWPRRQ
jgi:hypothetical protein